MPVVNSYHFLLGPIVALAAMGLITLLCRWVFSTDDRQARTQQRLERAASARDYGLLVPLTTVRTPEDAEMLRAVLREGGIRANVSPELELLVFRTDLDRARALVSAA